MKVCKCFDTVAKGFMKFYPLECASPKYGSGIDQTRKNRNLKTLNLLCQCNEGEPTSCKHQARFIPRKSVLALPCCFMIQHIGQRPVFGYWLRFSTTTEFCHDHCLDGDSVTRPEPKPISCWTIILNIIKSRPARTGNYPWIYTFH